MIPLFTEKIMIKLLNGTIRRTPVINPGQYFFNTILATKWGKIILTIIAPTKPKKRYFDIKLWGKNINRPVAKYDNNGVFDIPKDKFFFLGDNRSQFNDARKWINYLIDKQYIKGKAVFRYYPFEKMKFMSS